MSKAIDDVLAERRRQIEGEGWDEAHDDVHSDGSMAAAAACYAIPEEMRLYHLQRDMRDVGRSAGEEILISKYSKVPRSWPSSWAGWWWKPKDRRRDLVRAAALIIAEIERLDRAAHKQGAA
ncbi:MAG: hypothetical protein HYY97_16075 [Rhodocyclales bacterium]|nr:hypothetical protein [Rhodocyclales bacterium]